MKQPKNYQSAQEELAAILQAIQDPQANVDDLAKQVARAKELILWSRARLRSTEEQIEELLSELN